MAEMLLTGRPLAGRPLAGSERETGGGPGSGGLSPGATGPGGTGQDDPRELLLALAALPEHHSSRPAARAQVIESWLFLARALAHRYSGRGEPLPDLIQTAAVGLIKAVDRFDPARNGPFPAYAVPTIVGEIKRYFRDQGWAMRVPRRLQELRQEIAESAELLAQKLGHPPTVAELARDLRVDEEEVREGLGAARAYSTASLDAPARDDGEPGATVGDLLGEEDRGLALAELRLTVVPAVAALPDRERRILVLRFFGNLSQDQIARRVGISQMHVSRLLARTLAALRRQLRDDQAAASRATPAAAATPRAATSRPTRHSV